MGDSVNLEFDILAKYVEKLSFPIVDKGLDESNFCDKAVLEELTRMQLDGIEKVYIQDETLSCLKQLFDTEDQEEVSDEENLKLVYPRN